MKRGSRGDLDPGWPRHAQTPRRKRNSVPEGLLRQRLFPGWIRDKDEGRPEEGAGPNMPTLTVQSPTSPLSKQRKSLQENGSLLKSGNHAEDTPRRKSFDVAADSDRRPSVIGSLINRLPAMKKSDQKGSGSSKGSSTSSKPAAARQSPLVTKKSLPLDGSTSQGPLSGGGGHGTMTNLQLQQEDGALTGTSSEDLVIDNGSETGTDDVEGENNAKTKQVIEALQAKIQKTKEAIKKEQNNKESIVNEYLQMATDKQPTARIKALFEKKNQKSAQNIIQLQRKLEAHQARLTEVETHGYTGHKQAKEVLRDVGQGLKDVVEGVIGAKDTIVSKPKEFAHLIKNKFGSADNIAQIKLDDAGTTETDGAGKTGGTLPAGFKYGSDDENSSITSGSGLGGAHSSPHSTAQFAQSAGLSSYLEPVKTDLREVRDSTQKVNEVLLRLVEDFEEYKSAMHSEFSVLRGQLDEERYRVERLEEQLNDLTELHQHEMLNLKQDLASSEEKIEYRLDERTADLSDLVDNASTRILRL
ncbi:transmembrane and coiled-coil domains protein 2, partial [Aplysia californica]|uniref:Transmembrane and coiled-coil domains protein 2 n=1 Tax=Aplysia californica TaxID=6500 RepID=A0ABM1AC10_APLCA